jgi:hypothetical protein
LRRIALTSVATLGALAASRGAHAQNAAALAENIQRQLNVEDTEFRQSFFANTPIADRLLLEAGGTFRFAYSLIDNARSQEQQVYTPDLRLFLRAELDGGFRFFGRLRFQYNDWEYTGTAGLGPDPREDGWQWPVGEIYWGTFDLAGFTESRTGRKSVDSNLIIQGGRNYVIWAQGLVLSNYVYALQADLILGDLAITGILANSAGYDTVDWDTSRPGYDTDTSRLFSGGKLEWRGIAGHRPYAYYLWQNDLNGGQQATLGTSTFPIPTTFQYNSGYVGAGSTGSIGANMIYRSEFAWEYGTTLSDPLDPTNLVTLSQPQVENQISAVAGVVGLTWLARDAGDTRLDFQALAGSGSSERLESGTTFAGIAPGATDHSFNSLGYINTGLALAPEPANLFCPSLGLSSNLLPSSDFLSEFRVGVNGYLFTRIQNDAPISIQTRLNGSNLIGGEIDAIFDWRISSDVNLNVRYGIFMPNTSVFFPGEGGARDFVYAGVTYAF